MEAIIHKNNSMTITESIEVPIITGSKAAKEPPSIP
tara:strand:+ start:1254 stop:1361 length:108 start_codon:yes stop_codon:yes gene_type:complete